MNPLTREELEELTTRLITGPNRPVYDASGYPEIPHCLYFYYVTLTRLREAQVRVYFFDKIAQAIQRTELLGIVSSLATNARRNDEVPPKCGDIFEAIHWRRKSWLCMVLDDEEYVLEPDNAIVFDGTAGKTPNHTFLDGEDFLIAVPNLSNGFDALPTLACINHMKKYDTPNNLGKGEREYFSYSIIVKSTRTGQLFRQEIDPGGTNLGPAVGPP